MDSDGIPELIVIDERSKQDTVEFCMNEYQGYRCMHVRGHDGPHEAIGNQGPLRWTSSSPATGRGQGRHAAAAWLAELGLETVARWHIEVALEAGLGTRFHLNVYSEEWGFAFHHARRSSWIRVIEAPFVHGRDDFGLLSLTPELPALGALLVALETTHSFEFARFSASVRSNLSGATAAVRRWLAMSNVRWVDDLCGNEMHDGIRCTRTKGHDGHHAFATRQGMLQWKPTK